MSYQRKASGPDARSLSTVEILDALHSKFSANYLISRALVAKADAAEAQARALSGFANRLQKISGEANHQRLLATYMDEVFGDSMCAIYLASCGLTIPARMLVRRALELGLVVVAYWDDPVDFWAWREHDGDIRFSVLFSTVTSPGYVTFLRNLPGNSDVDISVLSKISTIYSELSNVVHPKPYNFATTKLNAYHFDGNDFEKTVGLAEKAYSSLVYLLKARFSSGLKE